MQKFLTFDITLFVCSIYVRFGRRLLLKALSDFDGAVIKMPESAEICMCQKAVQKRHPQFYGLYAVLDGMKLRLEQAGYEIEQNRHYNS